MNRRDVLRLGAGMPALTLTSLAQAHHGWSSFDQDRPIYLEGRAASVKWQNPHAELMLEVSPAIKVPADLVSRSLPAQSAPVDGKALLSKAVVPNRKDRLWEIELAPLTRLQAWKVPEIKPGTPLAMVGFIFKEEKGDPVLRVEYLFLKGRVYGMRSSPA